MHEGVLSPISMPLGSDRDYCGYALYSEYQCLPCSLCTVCSGWRVCRLSIHSQGEQSDADVPESLSNGESRAFQAKVMTESPQWGPVSPATAVWSHWCQCLLSITQLTFWSSLLGTISLPQHFFFWMLPLNFEHMNFMVLSYLPGVWYMILLLENWACWFGDSWLRAVCDRNLSCSSWLWPHDTHANWKFSSKQNKSSYLYQYCYLVMKT